MQRPGTPNGKAAAPIGINKKPRTEQNCFHMYQELSAHTKKVGVYSLIYHLALEQGYQANLLYRLAHRLYNMGLKAPAKLVSRFCLIATGADISPSAKIGARLYMPHTSGIVIGATAVVGEGCTILQGATLGSKFVELDPSGPRHPLLGNKITVGAGAKILGRISIGNGTIVGANAVVTKNVPQNSIAVGVNSVRRR